MSLPCIAISMGDPAGIGPEICLRLLAEEAIGQSCRPVVFGDAGILRRAAAACELPFDCDVFTDADWPTGGPPQAAVLDLPSENGLVSLEPGTVSAATGAASLRYVERAIAAALAGEVAGVATGPIHKKAWQQAGCQFPGHTELFADRTGIQRYTMMLTSEVLTCSLVTTHVGYVEAAGLISPETVLETVQNTHAALARMLGRAPRLAVCGLNPHAGEEGLFGHGEEEQLIVPAIETARSEGIDIIGPLPADTAFLPERRARIDGYICMYHDQGLIPLKTLAFDLAVNVTLGLPIVRTSVDHGTALDIAWQGKANASSLREAVRLAARLAQPAASYQEP